MYPPSRRTTNPSQDLTSRRPGPGVLRRALSFPRSTIINFAALLALVGVVIGLQVIGQRLESLQKQVAQATAPAARQTAAPQAIALAAAPTTPDVAPATPTVALPTVTTPQAPQMAAPQAIAVPGAPAPQQLVVAAPQPVVAVPQQTVPAQAPLAATPRPMITAPQPVAVAQQAVVAAPQPVVAAPQPAVAAPMPGVPYALQQAAPAPEAKATAKRASRGGMSRWSADREVRVEELDNESARQDYLSQTRMPKAAALPKTAALPKSEALQKSAALPKAAEAPAAPTPPRYAPAPQIGSAADLDGESARQWYQSENQRLSASRSSISKKASRTKAEPTADDLAAGPSR